MNPEEAKPEVDSTQPESGQVSSQPSADSSRQTPPPSGLTVSPPQKGKKGIMKIFIIVLVILLLAGGAYAIYKLALHKAKPTSQTAVVKHEIPVINFGLGADGSGSTMYPAITGLDNGFDLNQQIFEGLVQFVNITQVKPNLASSWTNPDDTTWDFQLARNVKFHTGRTMTAADVKYSLENFKDTFSGKLYNDTIKSVEVVNDNEVKLTTNGPDPLLLNKLAYLYILDSHSTLKNDAANGTGPYMVKPGTTPTDTETQLVAFDDWHGGRPLVRALNFKTYEDEAKLVAAAAKGEINATIDIFEGTNQAIMSKDSKFKVLASPNIGESVILLNTKKATSALSNLKVRQAFYAALDVPAILKARGLVGTVNNQIVPPTVPGYNPAIAVHKRDIQKAKALLTEAGYPKGVTLTISYLTQPGNGAPAEVVRQAKEAGITVKLNFYTDADKEEADIAAGKLEAWAYSINTQLLDLTDVYTGYVKPWFSDAKLAALEKQASTTIDSTERLDILKQMSKELDDNVALVPLYVRTQHYFVDPSFVITRDRAGSAFGVNFATVYAK